MAQKLKLRDGRDLSYSIFGVEDPSPGKTVIYFHGFMSGRLEAALLHDRAVELGCRLISADRAGYGRSTHHPARTPVSAVEDTRQLLEALLPADEKVIFYGVSGGAPYAAAAAGSLPHRAHGLLLAVPFAPLGDDPALWEGISDKGLRILRDARTHPFKTKCLLWTAWLLQRLPLRRLIMRIGGFAPVDIEMHRRFPEKSRQVNAAGRAGNAGGIKGAFRDLKVMTSNPVDWEALRQLDCRAAVWAGALDATTPLAMARAYAEAVPGARLHVVPDLGHFMGMQHGREVLASIL